ncbi:amidase [Virgibacillus sp. W0430]|uniref:amidase n=1 Tax=Virgibacillus sp. W0430 TaxID=3391580 RepID=UPI003F46993C
MNVHEYVNLDATEMAALIAKKEITPAELLQASFEQLENVNKDLNGIAHHRKEKVMKEAKHGKYGRGPFTGVPVLMKDISQAIAGERLTGGAKLLKQIVAEQDAHFTKKFREAGFLFMGHSSTPEFALKNITEPQLHGAARNPWNKEFSPGGSSGGSAAMIAAGVVPLAGASDGGGSIRIPASFTSLFGLKPTRGRTPVGPGAGRAWQGAAIDFVLSRTVRDSAAMLDVLQVNQPEAAFQAPMFTGSYKEIMKQPFSKPLNIAFTTKSPVGTPVSEDAKQTVEKTVKWLEDQGHSVDEKDNGVDGIQLMKDYFIMNSGEMATVIKQLEGGLGRKLTADDVEVETWMLNVAGNSVSAVEFSESLSSWDVAAAHMAKLHETYDFYITPATAFTAPRVGELTFSKEKQAELKTSIQEASKEAQQQLIYDMFLPSLTYTPFTQLANLTGQPAMSLPVHVAGNGLPIGVQVIAQKGREDQLLKLAYELEQTDLWVGMDGNPYFL